MLPFLVHQALLNNGQDVSVQPYGTSQEKGLLYTCKATSLGMQEDLKICILPWVAKNKTQPFQANSRIRYRVKYAHVMYCGQDGQLS